MPLLALVSLPHDALGFDNGAPHARLPPLGWSSWDALAAGADHPVRDFCDEVTVKAAADAYIEAGLYDAGYRHLHLDDCWAATERTAAGNIQPDPARFPGGMKVVADYVHSKGLVFGLCKDRDAASIVTPSPRTPVSPSPRRRLNRNPRLQLPRAALPHKNDTML